MVDLVLYASVFGAICWVALALLPWRPWSTREKIEAPALFQPGEDLGDITVLIPARNEGPYIGHTLNGVRAQGVRGGKSWLHHAAAVSGRRRSNSTGKTVWSAAKSR